MRLLWYFFKHCVLGSFVTAVSSSRAEGVKFVWWVLVSGNFKPWLLAKEKTWSFKSPWMMDQHRYCRRRCHRLHHHKEEKKKSRSWKGRKNCRKRDKFSWPFQFAFVRVSSSLVGGLPRLASTSPRVDAFKGWSSRLPQYATHNEWI